MAQHITSIIYTTQNYVMICNERMIMKAERKNRVKTLLVPFDNTKTQSALVVCVFYSIIILLIMSIYLLYILPMKKITTLQTTKVTNLPQIPKNLVEIFNSLPYEQKRTYFQRVHGTVR